MHSRQELSQMIEQHIVELHFPDSPSGLYDPIRYSLEGGGKRLRPLVLLLACEIFGGDPRRALPLAAAVEVFHNFTLLHDDIMDNAGVRRGKPSVHVCWDANTAILSGDVMMIWAYRLLAGGLNGDGRLLDQFSLMATEVCEGQQYDMDFESREQVSHGQYMDMIALKTAALIARSARMGAMAAGADEADCEALYRFGYQLGLAFQLQDDLLDSYGDNVAFGKKPGGDIIEGKKSFLTVEAMHRATPQTRGELSALLSDTALPDEQKVARVRAIYDSLDVMASTQAEIRRHTALALEALDAVAAPAARLKHLRELARELTDRKK